MSKFIQIHFFSSLHFFTHNQTKMREIKIFFILLLFHFLSIFYHFTFLSLQPNEPKIYPSKQKKKKKKVKRLDFLLVFHKNTRPGPSTKRVHGELKCCAIITNTGHPNSFNRAAHVPTQTVFKVCYVRF